MNYYQKNRDKILKKAHEKYHNGGGKEKTRYYRENKEEIKKRKEKDTENKAGLKRKTK